MAAPVRGHKPFRSTPEPRVSYLSGRHGAVRPGGPLHQPDRAVTYGRQRRAGSRPVHRGRETGPAPRTPSLPDLIRGGTSFRGDQHKAPYARPAHLCSRHQRPAGRPARHEPLRRARSRAPDRRGHGTGGQAAPSRTRLLRPAGAAPAGRLPGPVRPSRRPHPDRGPRRDPPCRAQPLGPQRAAQPATAWGTTTPASSRSPAICRPRGTTSPSCRRTCRCRIKASSVGLLAEEYRAELAITDSSGWTGMSELTLSGRAGGPPLRGGARCTSPRRPNCPCTPV